MLTSPPSALSVESAKCALREFKSVDDTTIERALLNGDRRLFVFAGAICGLRSNGLSRRGLACVRGPLRRKFISGVIGRRLAKDPADVTGAIAADRTALRRLISRCGGRGVLRRL